MDKDIFLQFYKIDEEELIVLIEEAKDYAINKGVAMKVLSLPIYAMAHLPFCFIPSAFPKQWFNLVSDLQPYINYILLQISYSKEILKEFLSSAIEADDFVQKIFNIFEKVYDSQCEHPSLGLLRCDYLLNCDNSGNVDSIKQVENNTIAAGMGGIGPGIQHLYEYILKKLGWENISNIPQNDSCSKLAQGMLSAWKLYNSPSSIILFVVEEVTYNIYDQRALEFKLYDLNKNIEILRSTFKQLRHSLVVLNNKLYVYGKEVAVVYYRCGYSPKHYEEVDWNTRLLIEKSAAIKCPTVGLHLAGTKRVQVYLTQRKILERFVSSEVAEKLQEVFTGLYLLDRDEMSDCLSKAIENPEIFVLKPEREGGGNNIHGAPIREFLRNITLEERKSYILMDRINPPESMNCIIRNGGNLDFCDVTSELGSFGVILGNKDNIYENYFAGHLVRSKPTHLHEIGLSAGFGALNYPILN